jgi:pyruvate dehydrogenase E2 component (dihydrolipoyllysine-residue acetyltransferase)
MGAIKEVLVPDIGDFSDIPVIEVMVKPGDRVKPEDSLIVLESDKATLDVPAPFGGAVRNLKVQVGDRVSEGTAILELEAEDAEVVPAVVAAPEAAAPAAAPIPEPAAESGVPPGLPHASPAIRRFARELGVELGHVPGTGPSQRILKEDVQSFVRTALSRSASPSAWRSVTIPCATHFAEADVTDLESFRAEVAASVGGRGIEVALPALLLKAVVAALQRFPSVNASFDGEHLVLGRDQHLGFAVDTPNGRVVPVILDVDRKGVLDLARELDELTAGARDGRIEPADLAGGTFVVASLGDADGTGFTPILHAPVVAILGVTRSQSRLVERNGKAVTRRMLPLCLSYDSRVIDPSTAARFTAFVAVLLGDLRRASL